MIRPLAPSKKLAEFLSFNTKIPFIAWLIILKHKYYIEVSMIDDTYYDSDRQKNHKLRSGVSYINIPKNTFNLNTLLRNDANILFNAFKLYNRFNKTHSEKFELLYNCCLKFIEFIINWSHYIIYNANEKHHQSFHSLYRAVSNTSSKLYYDIMNPNIMPVPKNKKDRLYLDDSIEISYDIKSFEEYITCSCNWHKNLDPHHFPSYKCCKCRDAEQYFYNYYNYKNNFTILRSGRYVPKPNSFNDPITVGHYMSAFQII